MKIVLGMLLSLCTLFSLDGKEVYEIKCASCHEGYIPVSKLKENFQDYNNSLLKLAAPTLNQLSYRLKKNIGDPKGDNEIHRMEVAAFIGDYVLYPDRQKSLCLDEVMQAFETMPSLKGKISEDELEAVSTYIYDFDDKVTEKNSVQYEGFEKALHKAKKEHKIIMLKVMTKDCHFCRKMDREVLVEEEIVEMLKEDFITVAIDLAVTEVPLGLKTEITPSFIFINQDAEVLMNLPGSWKKTDFIEILKEAKIKQRQKDLR